jgi:predicted dehydrogenase
VLGVFAAVALAQEPTPPIKVGIIGLDAHAVPWTQIINAPQVKAPISGMRIVAAYPSFSADVPFSADHIEVNIDKMRDLGVEITGSVDEMLAKVDAVLLLSIDGRPHPQQARDVFKTKKPLFIDKPVASSLVETIEVFREAGESGTPCFSNSALRYGPTIAGLAHDPKIGRVLGCVAYSNNQSILPGHPDLFYYGIHGCETLFTLMGPGCKTVTRLKTETADLASGVWEDGRLGTFRGILQGRVGFGATVFGEKGIAVADKFEGYEPLLAEIVKFFQTGRPPMTVEHTLEIYAFMEAADESLRQGGKPISIESVLTKAQEEAAVRRRK